MSAFGRLFSQVSDVELAQSEVDSARGRLKATVEQIQRKIAPTTLLDEAIEQVTTRSIEFAESAGEVVREHPRKVAAASAGIGLFLIRKRLGKLLLAPFRRKKATRARKRR